MNDIWNMIGAIGQIGEVAVLLGALYYAKQELRKAHEQNELDRKQHNLGRDQLSLDQLIAWKNSALGLNNLAMQYPDIFKEVLYPRSKDAAEVQKYTSAYSSLHALEVMYYMRKDEEKGEGSRLNDFLRQYVASYELRDAWKADAASTAYTKEFRDRLNDVIEKNPLPPKNAPSQ